MSVRGNTDVYRAVKAVFMRLYNFFNVFNTQTHRHLSLSLSLSLTHERSHTHTHTRTHI